MKKNTAAMSVTILMQPISVIWILSFICNKNSKEFKELFKNSKGFCMHHFRDLVEVGEKKTVCQRKTGVLSGSFFSDGRKHEAS